MPQPPHRPRRAQLRQRVPQRYRRNLAPRPAGALSYWTPRTGPGVGDRRLEQGMTSQKVIESVPGHGGAPRTAAQPLSPGATNHVVKPLEIPEVRCASVVLVMAPQLRAEGLLLFVDRFVPKLAGAISPSTLLRFHRALVRRQYQC